MATTEEDPDAYGPMKPVTERAWFKSLLWVARIFGGVITVVVFGKLAVWMWNWPIW